MRVFAPLKNFSSEVEQVDLDSNLKIVKFTSLEMKKIERAFREDKEITLKSSAAREIADHFNLHTEVQVGENENRTSELFFPTLQVFDQVINALNLFQKKSIWYDLAYTIEPCDIASPSLFEELPEESGYNLAKEGILELQEWWGKFLKVVTQNTYFKRAMNRFSQIGISAHGLDYNLIDYMIVFESLFSTGATESTHKVSRRVAVFLKEEKDDRIEIYKKMKEAYVLRGKIVHGEEIEWVKIHKLNYKKIRDYLRECLRKVVKEDYHSRENLIENLDFSQSCLDK